MKTKILTLLLLFFLFSCQQDSKTIKKTDTTVAKKEKLSKDINEFNNYSASYRPTEIDFSKNNEFDKFDLDFIYNNPEYNSQDSLKQHMTNVLLLKQYLFHISNYNQGYDLLTMRNGQAKFVIDYFLSSNKISADREFLNSGYPFELLRNKNVSDKEIQDLIAAIKKEENRILSQG